MAKIINRVERVNLNKIEIAGQKRHDASLEGIRSVHAPDHKEHRLHIEEQAEINGYLNLRYNPDGADQSSSRTVGDAIYQGGWGNVRSFCSGPERIPKHLQSPLRSPGQMCAEYGIEYGILVDANPGKQWTEPTPVKLADIKKAVQPVRRLALEELINGSKAFPISRKPLALAAKVATISEEAKRKIDADKAWMAAQEAKKSARAAEYEAAKVAAGWVIWTGRDGATFWNKGGVYELISNAPVVEIVKAAKPETTLDERRALRNAAKERALRNAAKKAADEKIKAAKLAAQPIRAWLIV